MNDITIAPIILILVLGGVAGLLGWLDRSERKL